MQYFVSPILEKRWAVKKVEKPRKIRKYDRDSTSSFFGVYEAILFDPEKDDVVDKKGHVDLYI